MTESFPSPRHVPPGPDRWGKFRYGLRRILDLQVASVLRRLTPWLEECLGAVLEVGCGAQPYRHLIPPACRYTALDWVLAKEHFSYTAPDTIYYNGEQFPFPEAAFDRLFHTEVLEHVWDPVPFLRECHRVLRPGGEMFFSIPFQARYHYIPHDYHRYTPSALNRLLTQAGFVEIRIQPRGTDITVACYKVVSVVYRCLMGGMLEKLVGVFLAPVLLPVGLGIGQWSLHSERGSADDTLGYTVTARRP